MFDVSWRFRWKMNFPVNVVEAVAESDSELAILVMVQEAVDTIETAEEYEGRVLNWLPDVESAAKVYVSFSIAFPNSEKTRNFMKYLSEIG